MEQDAAGLRKAKKIVLFIYVCFVKVVELFHPRPPQKKTKTKKNMDLLTQVDWKGCFFLGERRTKGMTV